MAVSKSQKRSTGLNGKAAVAGICVLLAVAVFLVFGQTLRYDFVNYDDDVYFSSNPHVQAGLTWPGALWAFTTGYDGIWHPLTWLSLMLDVDLFGTGPAGPHLTNVLLHAATAVLLFLVLRQMTGALWSSAFVAAIFSIHPLRVESVAWVTGRKDVLSGLFFMLTLGAYARYVEQSKAQSPKSRAFYGLALLFFALGLMSKPMLVTVPFVLLLLDFWPLGRFSFSGKPSTFNSDESRAGPPLSTWPASRLVIEKIPFLLLSAGSCLATVFAQPHNIARIEKISLDLRIYNAVVSYVIYLGKMVYPARLAVFYPYSASEMLAWKAGLGMVLLAGICIAFFWLRHKRPYLLVGWLWYLGMLVPVIGLMQVAGHARADRYTYLPQIGIYIIVAWGVGNLLRSWRYRRQVFGIAASIVIAALMACASIQTSYWRNSESLWTHALACTSRNYIAHNNLALVLAAQGQSADAFQHFKEALEINPRFVEAYNNLGVVLAQQGQSAEAIRHFQKAIELQPDCSDAYNSLGNALADQGHLAEAITNYQKAVKLNPDFAAAHYNLGNALALQGRYAEAIGHFRKTLQLKPDDAKARQSLDAALGLQSQSVKETGKPTNP
ncbi:MAG: tetratricopeptide repeat protein [Verrucomicrobiota bacterium]|jgi:Flp pilus assembly protein TadD